MIVGAGPVGLFAVFELGLLDLKCHLVDILDRPGGQCTELYPEKPIYDIPGWPEISAQGLVDKLMEQIRPFAPTFHFGEMVSALERTESGFRRPTDAGTDDRLQGGRRSPRAAARSSRSARRSPASTDFEGKSVFYSVRRMEDFRGHDLLIVGGGDSALDWVLEPSAAREERDAGAPPRRSSAPRRTASTRCWRYATPGRSASRSGQVDGACRQRRRMLEGAIVKGPEGDIEIAATRLLPFFGLTMKLGPVADWGLNLNENRIEVDTVRFETSSPGIFAIGDINFYPGKLKLILCGFHEAALMAQAAKHVVRSERADRVPVHDLVDEPAEEARRGLSLSGGCGPSLI